MGTDAAEPGGPSRRAPCKALVQAPMGKRTNLSKAIGTLDTAGENSPWALPPLGAGQTTHRVPRHSQWSLPLQVWLHWIGDSGCGQTRRALGLRDLE